MNSCLSRVTSSRTIQWFWLALRSVIIYVLFKPVQKLKKYMITDVPTDILEEVAEVIASVVRNGVRVDWMDET